MADISRSVQINALGDGVFDVLTDLGSLPLWFYGLVVGLVFGWLAD